MTELYYCKGCRRMRPLEAFPWRKKGDGHKSRCETCVRAQKRWYDKKHGKTASLTIPELRSIVFPKYEGIIPDPEKWPEWAYAETADQEVLNENIRHLLAVRRNELDAQAKLLEAKVEALTELDLIKAKVRYIDSLSWELL